MDHMPSRRRTGVYVDVTSREHDSGTVAVMGHTSINSRILGHSFEAAERLVVAPTGGVFEPAVALNAGQRIEAGQVVGHMSSGAERTPIVSMFAGRAGDSMAWAGERLTSHQPVMWLSATGSSAP